MALDGIGGLGLEVLARTERPSLAAQHHAPHRRDEAQFVGDRTEVVGGTPGPRVELLRPIERNDRDRAVPLELYRRFTTTGAWCVRLCALRHGAQRKPTPVT